MGGRVRRGSEQPAAGAVPLTPPTEGYLADAAMALLGCRTADDVYDAIGAFMLLLCPGTIIIVNETSDDLEWLITRRVFGMGDTMRLRAASVVGFNPVGRHSVIAPAHREELLNGKLTKVPGGFVELASFEVPRVVAKLAAEAFRLRGAYSIGIADGQSVLGNIQVYTREYGVPVPIRVIETFAHHCYSTLARIGRDRELARSALRIEELLGSERLLQLFFDRNPDAVVIIDPRSMRPVHFNETAHRQLGYTREEFALLGLGDFDESPPAQDGVRARIDHVMRAGRADYETGHRTKDGRVRQVRVEAQSVDTADGPMCFCVWRDITERRIAECSSREQSGRVDLLLDSTVEGIQGLDLDGRITFCNAAWLRMLGYDSAADVLGRDSHALFHYQLPDGSPYDASLCPIRQAVASGGSAHRDDGAFWRADGSMLPVEYWVRPVHDDGVLVGSVLTFVDVSERHQAEAAALKGKQRLERALRSITETVGKVAEMRDPYTQGHEQGVARLARLIAEEMGIQPSDIDGLEVAALVHDVGKLGLPAQILSKPGKLSDIEFELIKSHSLSGYEILKDIEFDWPVADTVLHHHERMDGSGYPDGLRGDEISIPARVLMVADVLDAMSSHRPYRPALGLDLAMAEITRGSGSYDPDVVSACVRLFESGRLPG
jgi:PAS domain S-box-containing protein